MLLTDLLKVATLQIYRKKRRYKGVLIGITLGIAGFVTILTMGDSVETDLGYNLELLGSATIVKASWELERSAKWHHGEYTEKDVEDLRKIPSARYVAPLVWSNQLFSANDRKFRARLMGVENVFFDCIHLPLAEGRAISDDDVQYRRSVCVIGAKVIENLFPDHPAPIGKQLSVGGHRFTIVGIIGGVEDPGFLESVLIPLTVARSRFPNMHAIRDIYVRAETWNDVDYIYQTVGQMLRNNKPGYADAIVVKAYPERIRTIQQAVLLVKIFISAALAITLALGGLGIMNVMLAAVRERTTEIGLRKAVGATQSSIMSQFLLESVVVSMVGSFFGIIVGFISVEILKRVFGTVPDYRLFVLSLIGGVAFGAALGIISGYLPAKKAGKLDPAEAMRFE